MVVLSYSFWQTQFGGDPGILKRDLVLDGEPHRIIGVLPAGSFDRDEARFWKPLIFAPDQLNRGQHWLHVIGRLRSGVSIEQARAKMNMLRASLDGVISAKGLGLRGGSVRADAGWRYPAPLDLPGVRSGSDGVAHRLRECGEPGAGQRSNPAEGDGPQSRSGGRPRPFDRAVAHREPGLVSSRRHGGYCAWPTCCFMPRPHWWRHRCRLRPISAWICASLALPRRP